MSLVGIGWLWSLFWRMWRKGSDNVTPGIPLPAWPRGASAIIHLHNARTEEKKGEVKRVGLCVITLCRHAATGAIRDERGRELITVVVHTKRDIVSWWERWWRQKAAVHISELRQSPEAILRALSGEILAGQMITLLFTDDRLFGKPGEPYRREGIIFIDAACAWIDRHENWPTAVVEKTADADELVAA